MKNWITKLNVVPPIGVGTYLVLYSVFISFFLLVEFSKTVNFNLTTFSTLYIGEATAYGVDVGLRIKWMYRLLFTASFLFFTFFYFLKLIFRNIKPALIKKEELVLMSVSGIVLSVMQVFGTDSTHLLSAIFYLFFLKLLLVVLENYFPVKLKLANASGIFSLSVSFSFLLLFAFIILSGNSGIVYKNYSTILIIGTVLMLLYYYIMLVLFNKSIRKITGFLLPLSSIPFLLFFSIEAYFYLKLKHHSIIDYKGLFYLLFIVFTFAIYVCLVFLKKKSFPNKRISYRYIIPSLLFAYVFLTKYYPVVENVPDLFEPSNLANGLMKVFEFGQIPVVDFMSSHMLSEQWFGYIYSALFGFKSDLSFLSYSFFNDLIYVVIIYYIIYKTFNKSVFALVFIFLFPLVHQVFFHAVIIGIVPLFFMKQFITKNSTINTFAILMLMSFMLIWRIDTGVVAIIATTFCAAILFYVSPLKLPIKTLFRGLLLYTGAIGVLVGAACLLRSPEIIVNRIQNAIHYIVGSQAHGYKSLVYYTHQFYIYHIILPLIAMFVLFYAIHLLNKKHKESLFTKGYVLVVAIFLFLMFFGNIQRGLVRHGFAELNEEFLISVFHAAVAMFITYQFNNKNKLKKFTVFYSVTFVLFIGLKYFSFQIPKIQLEEAFTSNRFSDKELSFNNKVMVGRVKTDSLFAKINYADFKSFLDNHLTKEQTFLDFSNTPMLYYYCNRKSPGYFNQNLQNSIDDYLQLQLLKEVDTNKSPIIVFSSYPPSINDAMDNIPNVMRHYLVAEYIFKNYQPICVLNNKSIWGIPTLVNTSDSIFTKDTLCLQPKSYNYKLIAEYIGYHFTTNKPKDVTTLFSISAKKLDTTNNSFVLPVPNNILQNHHCFLAIEFNKAKIKEPYSLNVQLIDTCGKYCGSFSFERSDRVSNRYFLRLSNHYLWHIKNISKIQVSFDADIKSFEFIKDNRIEH